jgi:hypothetical protein
VDTSKKLIPEIFGFGRVYGVAACVEVGKCITAGNELETKLQRVDDGSGERTDLAFVKEGDEVNDANIIYLHCFDVVVAHGKDILLCEKCGLDSCLQMGEGSKKLRAELREKVAKVANKVEEHYGIQAQLKDRDKKKK